MADIPQRRLFFDPPYPPTAKVSKWYHQTMPMWPPLINSFSEAASMYLDIYQMLTPNGAAVCTLQHAADYSKYDPNNREDCMNYALGIFARFGYGIAAGSMWDFLNDPALATKIADNEQEVIPKTSSQLRSDEVTLKPSLLKVALPVDKRPQAGDVLVFWGFLNSNDHVYLCAMHAVTIVQPIFDGAGKLLATTVVNSKNGNKAPKQYDLNKVFKKYPAHDMAVDMPVGIYRLKPYPPQQ